MARSTVVVAVPVEERAPLEAALAAGDYEMVAVDGAEELAAVLARGDSIGVAILDAEGDLDTALELYSLLREGGRAIPALIVVAPSAIGLLGTSGAGVGDEYITRPYSPESVRWQVEAMLIRAQVGVAEPGSGAILRTGTVALPAWDPGGPIIAVFNPKGGVGKTTIAANVAASFQLRRGRRVLLVDADVVSGHLAISLGVDQVHTLADALRDETEGGDAESIEELAAAHPSGMRVAVLSADPLRTAILDPARVADTMTLWRRSFEVVVVDLHPDYDPLNRAILAIADRILMPVTPDLPAIRAAVQLLEVAEELGLRDRLELVINRANSGVSVADMERTIGLPAIGQIRSAGMLFVRASNEGRTVIERFPREKVTEDFEALADRLALPHDPPEARDRAKPAKRGLFGRPKAVART